MGVALLLELQPVAHTLHEANALCCGPSALSHTSPLNVGTKRPAMRSYDSTGWRQTAFVNSTLKSFYEITMSVVFPALRCIRLQPHTHTHTRTHALPLSNVRIGATHTRNAFRTFTFCERCVQLQLDAVVKRIAAGMNANKQYEQDQRQKERDRHKDKGMLGLAVEIGQQIVSLHDAITMADEDTGLPVTDVSIPRLASCCSAVRCAALSLISPLTSQPNLDPPTHPTRPLDIARVCAVSPKFGPIPIGTSRYSPPRLPSSFYIPYRATPVDTTNRIIGVHWFVCRGSC
jgi:hypothetical protein